jgi:hypothetical protein
LYDNATKALTGIAEVRRVLEEGLTPREIAVQAMGKKYLKDLEKGMNSEIPGLKETSWQTGAAAINAIEDAAGGTPDSKGLKRIGEIYDAMLASGLTAAEAKVLLAASGVSSSTLNRLEGAADDAYGIGESWTLAVARGIQSRTALDKLHNALSAIDRQMHGQSPPPEGPLKDIDKGGFNVGKAWIGGMSKAIQSGQAMLGFALGSSPLAMAGPNLSITPVSGAARLEHTIRFENLPPGINEAAVIEATEKAVNSGADAFVWNLEHALGLANTG